ncbi:uncharacterized protein KY384_005564 [Bacidia gigantensis]|uniref:uncharacterized protein n=1 Tax=Bacidia gigantensis TaxID=2732470 RepID=UPI001D0561DF|nr:uncharacterized protein KY384_005564 [Bacidia gigantensis]KAG8530082.1 hypothetical protein KY384_005564 [Bacidia gigantensis]
MSLGRAVRNQKKYKHLNAVISSTVWSRDAEVKLQKYPENPRVALLPLRSRWEWNQFVFVKDNICTKEDAPVTCGSALLAEYRSPFKASVISKLEARKAPIAGTTNLDEFGMGSDTTHSHYGVTKNSYSDQLSAGGSSGGSAVVVATNQCRYALGTDTGGSIRLPAAYNGVVGFKPSYGMAPRKGVVAYANSLDTVGVLAQRTWKALNILACIRSHDDGDPTNLRASQREGIKLREKLHRANLENTGIKLRIGVPKEYNTLELQPVVRDAWIRTLQLLQYAGQSIHPISLPSTRLALSTYYILAPAEASSNLARYDGIRYGRKKERSDASSERLFSQTRGQGLGEEVKRRILLGAYSLSAGAIDNHFIQAQKARRLVQEEFDRVFAFPNPLRENRDVSDANTEEGVDMIITPTVQSLPPRLEDVRARHPVDSYSADVLTVPASLAGLPAVSVPVPVPREYGPVAEGVRSTAVQIIGQFSCDSMVIRTAQLIEALHAITGNDLAKELTPDQISGVKDVNAFSDTFVARTVNDHVH